MQGHVDFEAGCDIFGVAEGGFGTLLEDEIVHVFVVCVVGCHSVDWEDAVSSGWMVEVWMVMVLCGDE